MSKDFLSVDDVDADGLRALLDDADSIKEKPGVWESALRGKQIALIFEKPSTRTRVSFEVGVNQMGGSALVLRGDELQMGRGETHEDTGRVMSRFVDAIVMRTFGQDRLERLADAASVPVVNALSDYEHPCQCLADLQTIREKKGDLEGVRLAYVGDGNNVLHSLLLGGAKTGMDVRAACPKEYQPFPRIVERAQEIAAHTGAKVMITDVVAAAALDADVLYTDVWASMGQEDQAENRRKVFERYRIDGDVVDQADMDCIVMHCLPAHRGEEISADVFEGPRSVVWDQAENRLHTQKALLANLMGA